MNCKYQYEAYETGRAGETKDMLVCKCKQCVAQYEAGRKEHARELVKAVEK